MTIYLKNKLSEHLTLNICLDPVKLSGEGEYNLDILKQIEVTDSFLGLDKETILCEKGKNSFDNCTTRVYHEQMRLTCGCLPYSINDDNEACYQF